MLAPVRMSETTDGVYVKIKPTKSGGKAKPIGGKKKPVKRKGK